MYVNLSFMIELLYMQQYNLFLLIQFFFCCWRHAYTAVFPSTFLYIVKIRKFLMAISIGEIIHRPGTDLCKCIIYVINVLFH